MSFVVHLFLCWLHEEQTGGWKLPQGQSLRMGQGWVGLSRPDAMLPQPGFPRAQCHPQLLQGTSGLALPVQ